MSEPREDNIDMAESSEAGVIDPSEMSPIDEYIYYRRCIGTRQEVADLMKVTFNTVRRREIGDVAVTLECIMAIRYAAYLVGVEVDHKLAE